MTNRRMYRYEVPVDDQPHSFQLTSDPVAAASSDDLRTVEFWAEDDAHLPSTRRFFQVYGTGHTVPPDAVWRGTCDRVRGLVWHLYEVKP